MATHLFLKEHRRKEAPKILAKLLSKTVASAFPLVLYIARTSHTDGQIHPCLISLDFYTYALL